jgi:hypothetical protein
VLGTKLVPFDFYDLIKAAHTLLPKIGSKKDQPSTKDYPFNVFYQPKLVLMPFEKGDKISKFHKIIKSLKLEFCFDMDEKDPVLKNPIQERFTLICTTRPIKDTKDLTDVQKQELVKNLNSELMELAYICGLAANMVLDEHKENNVRPLQDTYFRYWDQVPTLTLSSNEKPITFDGYSGLEQGNYFIIDEYNDDPRDYEDPEKTWGDVMVCRKLLPKREG